MQSSSTHEDAVKQAVEPRHCARCSGTDEELLAALMEADDLRSRLQALEHTSSADIQKLAAENEAAQKQLRSCMAEVQQQHTNASGAREEADEASSRALCSATSLQRLHEDNTVLKGQMASAVNDAAALQKVIRDLQDQLQLANLLAGQRQGPTALQQDASEQQQQQQQLLEAAKQQASSQQQLIQELQEQLQLAHLLAIQSPCQPALQQPPNDQQHVMAELQQALDHQEAEARSFREQLSDAMAASHASQEKHDVELRCLQQELEVRRWMSQ